MIDITLLREQAEDVAANLARRGFTLDIEKFKRLDSSLNELRVREEKLRSQRNGLSKRIGELMSSGNKEEAESLKKEATALGDSIGPLHAEVVEQKEMLDDFMLRLPNMLDPEVPDGKGEDDNKLVREVGEPRKMGFAPLDHVALGEMHGLLDFDAASRMAQARFVVMRGAFASMHRALAQFMLDLHVNEHGYQEQYVPYMVDTKALTNTGQLPKFGTDDEFFSCKKDDLHLIPTAEVALANLAAGQEYKPESLPVRYVAHSPCFRREAGSYGKDTKGMLRQHQFDKVELVQYVEPGKSSAALEELLGHAETVLRKLELPYRVVELCTSDIGSAAARTFDIEVWLPGQQRYREISSCSNDRDFQSRRMRACLRLPDKRRDFIHILNGSGVAIGRALIAVLENYQEKDGSIAVPAALRDYLGGSERISKPA